MTERNVLITGASGFLGSRLAAGLKNEERFRVRGIRHRELDITNADEVMEFFRYERADVVIHCAAVSNTAVCEQNPELSELVNVIGTRNLAIACKESGAKFLFCSSDQIYAGCTLGGSGLADSNANQGGSGSAVLRPNSEEDEAMPINVYGEHKRRSELEICSILPDAVSLRLTWMYDFPVRGMKSSGNLLCNIVKSLIRNQPMKMAVHDYRGITWTGDVVRNMPAAMDLPGGVYNFGSPNDMSAYGTARRFTDLLAPGREDMILADEERFADRPRNLTVDMKKAEAYGILFPDTGEGLKRCLDENPEYSVLL